LERRPNRGFKLAHRSIKLKVVPNVLDYYPEERREDLEEFLKSEKLIK
jgi:hypothetical protein